MEHDDTETFSENVLAYLVWIVSEIGLHAKCLLFGWPKRGGENYCDKCLIRVVNF